MLLAGCKVESILFLNDPSHEFEQLMKYPVVARVFVNYNTSVPSSALVERLFSQAGLILTYRRNKLSSKSFETHLLVKKTRRLHSDNISYFLWQLTVTYDDDNDMMMTTLLRNNLVLQLTLLCMYLVCTYVLVLVLSTYKYLSTFIIMYLYLYLKYIIWWILGTCT